MRRTSVVRQPHIQANRSRNYWSDSDICIARIEASDKCRNQEDTSKLMNLVNFSNLAFETAYVLVGIQTANSIHQAL